ncbi:winged helix-turn-helix transcriptional regulator [Candidatus Woesearchaeota archaeon]|nr:winged helix-turn-helix transcriptional regulator [Candidatus Woesearchaeota archaeon]
MTKFVLDMVDRKILSELDKNCRISTILLAKKVHKSRETVKYRIQQLQEKGIIQGFITSINPNKLGYYMFKVYLKLENIPEEKEKFLQTLRTDTAIYWIGISDGAFDLVFAVLSKSIPEYYSNVNSLLSGWKHLIVTRVLGSMVDTEQYNKKFFLEEKNSKVHTFGGDIFSYTLDPLDGKILTLLANDARIPILELSRKVKSSVDIVRTRIKKLEEKEIIIAYRIAVDFNLLHKEFFKAIVYFRSLSQKEEHALGEWMKCNPHSLYYIRSLAPWDAELEFVVDNYPHFNQIMNDLKKQFPHMIRNTEHLIMISEYWMPAYREILKGSEK